MKWKVLFSTYNNPTGLYKSCITLAKQQSLIMSRVRMKICNSSQTVLLIISLLNIIAIFSSCEDWYNLGLFDVAIQFYAFTIFSLKLSLNHVWASYIIGVHFINCNRKTFTWNIIIKQSLASLSLIDYRYIYMILCTRLTFIVQFVFLNWFEYFFNW